MLRSFQVAVKYQKEDICSFQRVHYHFILSQYRFFFFDMILLTIPLIILYLFNGVLTYPLMAILLLLIDVLLLWEYFGNFLPDRRSKKIWKRDASTLEEEHVFRFTKEKVQLLHTNPVVEIFYRDLYRVLEVENAFYFYIHPRNALIVKKDGFTKQNLLGLQETLQKTIGKRYQRKSLA